MTGKLINKIKNTAELRGLLTRYVINNHLIKINHAEFYSLGSDNTEDKWFLVCSYQGERLSKGLGSEPTLTIEVVKTAMRQLIDEMIKITEKQGLGEIALQPSPPVEKENK